MKHRTLLALLLAPLFSSAALAAGYSRPGAQQINSVAAALEAADETSVVLEGRLLRQIRGEHYEFADVSGKVEVEIDHEDMPAQAIGFDEGPKLTDWVSALNHRGISVVCDVLRNEAVSVLQEYISAGGTIYNPSISSSR